MWQSVRSRGCPPPAFVSSSTVIPVECSDERCGTEGPKLLLPGAGLALIIPSWLVAGPVIERGDF